MKDRPDIDYSGRMASVYERGRSLPQSVVKAWADMAAKHAPPAAAGMACDLGSGTGRFSAALASRLDRPVVAIEPADAMRDRARTRPHPGVSIVAGRAEQIPARASVFSLVWMSQSIHHVQSLAACARELDRTLCESGRVVLRGMFDMRAWVLAPYFPGAKTIAEDRFPSLRKITDAFGHVGLQLSSHEKHTQASASTAEELVERTRLRADSTLALLPDREFQRGLARLAEAASEGVLPEPVLETLDLVVFARS